MLSKKQLGIELKHKMDSQVSLHEICQWAYEVYYQHCSELDPELEKILIDLFSMEEGPKFKLTNEQLNSIVEYLIYDEEDRLNTQNKQYNRRLVAKELEVLLDHGADIGEISRWAYDLTINATFSDPSLHDILCTLDAMDAGPEFEYSKEELRLIGECLLKNEHDPFEQVHLMRKIKKDVGLEEPSSVYDRKTFGKGLKSQLMSGASMTEIARWANDTVMYDAFVDQSLEDIATIVAKIDVNQEYSVGELWIIAKMLIKSKKDPIEYIHELRNKKLL